MKVTFTDEALRDLDAIGDYIAEDSPSRALRFVAELVETAREIGDNPRAFQAVRRYRNREVRRRVHGSYLIFYRIEPDLVSVLHVLHGAQDYEALLFPD